jgi:hypothetical protein
MWFSSLWEKTRKVARASAKKLREKLPRKKLKPYRSLRVEEMPDNVRPLTLYLCGEGEHLWAAAMVCPCGCKEVIQLNLLKQVRPRWSVQEHKDGSVSLMPSVWRQKGCRSHFFVRHGRIDWCREYSSEGREGE